jgi:hypothetical protein
MVLLSDVNSFWFGSTFNPDSSICMNYSYSPWFFFPYGLCFAEDTVLLDKYFITNFIILVSQLIHYFHLCCCDQFGFAFSLQFVSSQLQIECRRAYLIQI